MIEGFFLAQIERFINRVTESLMPCMVRRCRESFLYVVLAEEWVQVAMTIGSHEGSPSC